MGLVEGAIIGAVVGAVTVTTALVINKGGRKKLVAALGKNDPAGARAVIDKTWKQRQKLNNGVILTLMHRFTALAALGDLETVRSEMAALQGGGKSARVQLESFVLLVRKLLGDPDQGIAGSLDDLAAEFEREGGKIYALVKKHIRARAALAHAVDGNALDPETLVVVEAMQRGAGAIQCVYQLGLMYHRLAAGFPEKLVELKTTIETEWPNTVWSRQAAKLAERGGATTVVATTPAS